MQKRASISLENHYDTYFDPLPVGKDGGLHFDTRDICLPYAEDFPRLHYHDRFEVGICKKGDGLFLSDGSFFPLSEGDAVFVSPGCRHYSRSLYKDKLCICRFAFIHPNAVCAHLKATSELDTEYILGSSRLIPAILRADEHPRENSAIRELVSGCAEPSLSTDSIAAMRLAIFLLKLCGNPVTPRENDGKASISFGEFPAAARAAEYIYLHYNEPLSAAELALMYHISESQLRRQFISAYGMPPIAYRNMLRCRIAAELLTRSALSVSEISYHVGYSSVSDFYRAFIKLRGVSPSEYRKEQILYSHIKK